jgi:DNA-binding phage protein
MQSAGASTVAKGRAKAPEPSDRSPVHRKLRALVEERKGDRTHAEIASAAGMSRAYFSHLLSGKIVNPRLDTLLAVLDAIGASLCDYDRIKPPENSE